MALLWEASAWLGKNFWALITLVEKLTEVGASATM